MIKQLSLDNIKNQNKVEEFYFKELNVVRVIRKEGGEPWFCLLDVCNILGIENNRNVVNRLESGGVHTTDIPTYGMNQLSDPYLSNIDIGV